jgi:small-conductance mechanosensitive channel
MPSWLPDTKSHAWEQAGLAAQVVRRDARRARIEALFVIPAIAGVLVVFSLRERLFPHVDETWVRVGAFFLLVVLGYRLASLLGRALGPALMRRVEPGTAGTVAFLIRLATGALAIIVALRVAGLDAGVLAVGGAVTGVVIGLAAQQTLGNLFSGMVLISARPFKVGDRVRLLGGNVNGELEATVSSLGMLYATFVADGDRIMIPNNIVMQLSVMPLRDPTAVDLRARVGSDVRPTDLERRLANSVTVPTRGAPRIDVEEIDGDEVVVRVTAAPLAVSDGPALADELLAALAEITRQNGDNSP